MAWDIHAFLEGYVIRFHGEIVASAGSFEEARATYNRLRAHAAMALESLWLMMERAA